MLGRERGIFELVEDAELFLEQEGSVERPGLRPLTAVKSLAVQVPVGLSLCGADLLVEGVGVGFLVSDSVEVLAVDVGEGGAVAGVGEEQVKDRPDE